MKINSPITAWNPRGDEINRRAISIEPVNLESQTCKENYLFTKVAISYRIELPGRFRL